MKLRIRPAMSMFHHTATRVAGVVFAALALLPCPAPAKLKETNLSSEEWSKLDTFESHVLSKANKTFNAKQWRQAYAEYDSFLVEFSRSKAVPFVLFRKGRCKQEDAKLFKAIDDYEEVLDYFPNHIPYAAPALYHIGECHQNKGDIREAMKAWAEMANDKDYSKHPLAALAVTALADNLVKQDKEREAVKYYEQVAIDFRASNREAADHAAGPVTTYYMRTMQEEPYRAFFNKRGIRKRNTKQTPPLEQDSEYWKNVIYHVERQGKFETVQKDLRNKYYGYWVGKLRGKLLDDDWYQLRLINWQFSVDGDAAKWSQSIDRQFERRFRPGDYSRIIWWMSLCRRDPDKVEAYYRKLNTAKLTLAHKASLIEFFYRGKLPKRGRAIVNLVNYDKLSYEEKKKLAFLFFKLALKEDARIALGKINYGELTDDAIEGLGNELGRAKYDSERMIWVWYRMRDRHRAQNLHMRHCHRVRDSKGGLPVATALTGVDKYAQSAWKCKGDFHKWSKQYPEAISAYRSCDDPPGNLWGIVECLVALKKYREAIAQLKEIENFFEKERARAAFAIADVYRKADDKAKYISSLRVVLKKYPETGESSQAHQRLEKMGVKMGGAVDAD
jgi:TolA-binding protein